MNYIEKKLIIPYIKLSKEFITLFKQMYGTPMHWDNTEKTRMRIADIEDGTILPTPILNNEGIETGEYYIIALWPEAFINDIQNYPRISFPPMPIKTENITDEDFAEQTVIYNTTCNLIIDGFAGLRMENL